MLCVNTNNGLTNEGNANVYMSKLNRHYNIESLSCMIQHPVHEWCTHTHTHTHTHTLTHTHTHTHTHTTKKANLDTLYAQLIT